MAKLSISQRRAKLQKIVDDALEELANMDVKTNEGSLPNSSGAGSSVDHGEYERRLREKIQWASEQIQTLTGPFEGTSEARP